MCLGPHFALPSFQSLNQSRLCASFSSSLDRQIPPLKQRIAGKSLPVEKFAVAKSERYLQGARLPLCGLVRCN